MHTSFHERKSGCFSHQSGGLLSLPTHTRRGKTTKTFSKYFHLKIWNPHNDFQKRKIRLVGNTIDQPIPKHKLLISIPAKKFNYIQKKRFILLVIYIQIHYICKSLLWLSGLAHPYLYSFIHSYIKNNSNSTINSAVKSQFGPQYNFKFALFCNTTALQMSNITPL